VASSSFGVDAESVRRHHFTNFDAFSSQSRPSVATVAEAIDEEAAVLAGALAKESIDAASITVITSGAYVSCRKVLRMQVAARLARDIPGIDTALARSWSGSVTAWYEELAKSGATFLGDGATSSGTSEPDGRGTALC
jgi:hypothetical protein